MKRTRFDSEYDKVRRAAGYTKPNYEFPEAREEQLSQERVAAASADFRASMDELANAENALSAEKRVRFDQWRKEHNLKILRREYLDLGITPPVPLVSLGLLIQLGWRVEPLGVPGRCVLVRPMHVNVAVPETRPCEMGS